MFKIRFIFRTEKYINQLFDILIKIKENTNKENSKCEKKY